jgi:uroporphyrinogen decarboxylase
MYLSSKERVKLACNFEEPDRPPIQIYMTPEIQAKLENHFRGRDLLETLGVDFRFVGDFSKLFNRPPPDKQSPELTYDIWGIGYKQTFHAGGSYAEPYYLPFRKMGSLSEVEAYPWPDPNEYEFSDIRDSCEKVQEYAVCFGGAGIPDILNGVSGGRGHDRVIKDIMTGDKVGVAIIDKRVEFWYQFCRKALQAAQGKVDIFWLGEDLGTQNGPFFSRKVFDDFFRPRLKRFYDLGHEFGAKVAMHSCGSTRIHIPSLIEMRLDILDAVQPEPLGMDPYGLKRDFGEKIVFCGMISTQKTLPYGTVEDCRREALHRIQVIGKGGGYIFAPAHCIQPDTPIENILAIYEVANGKEKETRNKSRTQ